MLLIGNGRVITRDQENPYLEDGAVVISGEKIKEVGSLTEMKAKYPEAEFVDAKGGVIMPGLLWSRKRLIYCWQQSNKLP